MNRRTSGQSECAANVYAGVNVDAAQLQGKASTFTEGASKSFTVYLNKGAKAGETFVLNAMAGLKAILGDETVDANGAVINLREGQTQVSFALVSDSAIEADQSGSICVSYQGTGANAQSATSNSWAITVKDAGEPDNAEHPLEGDYLVKTETYTSDTPLRRTKPYGTLTTVDDPNTPSVIVLEKDQLYYVKDGQGNLAKGSEDPTYRPILDGDGHVIGQKEIPSDDKTVTDNTLFGSAAKDKIDGKTGNDLIDGKGGKTSAIFIGAVYARSARPGGLYFHSRRLKTPARVKTHTSACRCLRAQLTAPNRIWALRNQKPVA
jgi:hypothetical protein